MFTISREGVQDADRDGLLGANRSNSLAIARICNNADRPIPRLHTRVEIVNTLLEPPSASATPPSAQPAGHGPAVCTDLAQWRRSGCDMGWYSRANARPGATASIVCFFKHSISL